MVAPLITGTARVSVRAGNASVKRKHARKQRALRPKKASNDNEPEYARSAANDNELSRSERIARAQEKRPELLRRTRAHHRKRKIKNALVGKIMSQRALAMVTSIPVLIGTLPFYFTVQITFGLMGLGFLAVGSVPLSDLIVPGRGMYIFTHLFIGVLGIISMGYAAIIYTMRGVNCFGGGRTVIFIICITGYFTFFLNLFPWIILWVVAVIFTQKKEGENSQDQP